jgi:hypothetical protein
VAVIMCLGAIFAALNTMYASVSTRTREIATLRAIGFGPLPVVASVLVESMLLALAGGVIGAFLAWLLFNGMTVSTLGGSTFTQLVFDFKVSPALVGKGLVMALGIGLVGGLVPAVYSSHSRHASGVILTVAMPLCAVGIDLLATGTLGAASALVGAALGISCALAFLGLAFLLRKPGALPLPQVLAVALLLVFLLAEVAIAFVCAGSFGPFAALGALLALLCAFRPIHGRLREPWNDAHFSDPVLAGLKAA